MGLYEDPYYETIADGGIKSMDISRKSTTGCFIPLNDMAMQCNIVLDSFFQTSCIQIFKSMINKIIQKNELNTSPISII